MTTTTRLDPTVLLSRLAAREDLSRGFGARVAPVAGAVPMLGGAPSPDLLPLDQLAAAAQELTAAPDALVGALQYDRPAGREALRSWIARREGVEPSRVLVTNGAFHGLSLVFDALLDRGDEVVVEDPTYPLIFRDLQHHEPVLLPLPLGPDGLDLASLEARLAAGARPKLLYTVPDFHNPTGFVTPPAQRDRLVELAEQHGFVIVSDNAYQGLAFDAAPPADYPLDSDRVVHVRTFSKVLGPGLRLGWLVLPEWLLAPVTRLRANQDQHSSALVQAIVERVVGAVGPTAADATADATVGAPPVGRAVDPFDAIASRARASYAARFDLVAGVLDAGLPGGIEVEHRTGGIFLWARVLEEGIDLAAAQHLARTRYGTDAVLGRYFFGHDPEVDRGHLRIGISHLAPEQLRVGAERLVESLTDPEARR